MMDERKPMTSFADEELLPAVEAALEQRIVALERMPSKYRTRFAIEELNVETIAGERYEMLIKYVGREDLIDSADRAKPTFLFDPQREIRVYRDILASARLGTPRPYACATNWKWIVLERFKGVELYQVGEIEAWQRAAEWLAEM